MHRLFVPAVLAVCGSVSGAAPVSTTPDWMAQACEAWDKNPILTNEFAER